VSERSVPNALAVDHLVPRARAGDGAAVEEVLAAIAPAVYRYGRRMCGSAHEADDVLQDTLLNVALHLDDFEGRAAFSSWVFALCRSACARRRRGLKNRPPLAVDEAPEACDPGPSPEALAAEREVLGAVLAALDRLSPEAREVLLLRDVEGLTAPEAAAALEISIDALKSRLHRARTALRRELEPGEDRPASTPGCPDVMALWSKKLDGDLTPIDCASMEAHLAVCPRCSVACDTLRNALSACQSLSTTRVPAHVQERVKAAARAWVERRSPAR